MFSDELYFFATLLVYCGTYFLAAGLAVNLVYHRCLSHRSFELWKPMRYLFVTLGLPVGTPVSWIGNHRFHHQNADQPGDPHSPYLDGFWHAHVGWYIGTKTPWICFIYSIAGPFRMIYDGWNRPRTGRKYDYLARDISSDAYFHFLSRPAVYTAACWIHTAIFFGIAFLFWEWTGVIFLWLTLTTIYNLGDAIDRVAHRSGAHLIPAEHLARNNLWLGVLTLGEGWHANHHNYPFSAKHGLYNGQPDATWRIIQFLEMVGAVRNVKIPQDVVMEGESRGVKLI